MTVSDRSSTVRRVLVPVELGAPDSEAAVELAGTLAHADGAAVTLLHVTAPPDSMIGIVPGADDDETDLELERSQARQGLETFADALRARGVAQVSILVESGFPSDAILERARAGDFELIVMGTHGRTGLARFVLGSVSAVVVRRAACRVLTVHVPTTALQNGEEP